MDAVARDGGPAVEAVEDRGPLNTVVIRAAPAGVLGDGVVGDGDVVERGGRIRTALTPAGFVEPPGIDDVRLRCQVVGAGRIELPTSCSQSITVDAS